jgi:hypothetical protein
MGTDNIFIANKVASLRNTKAREENGLRLLRTKRGETNSNTDYPKRPQARFHVFLKNGIDALNVFFQASQQTEAFVCSGQCQLALRCVHLSSGCSPHPGKE